MTLCTGVHSSPPILKSKHERGVGMQNRKICVLAFCFSLAVLVPVGVCSQAELPPTLRIPDVVYLATPPEVVEAMLAMAGAGKGDVLYDLGSGDGRIPIAAVQKFDVTKAVGIDIDPDRIQEANDNAQKAGLTSQVTFRNEDLFQANFSEATIVTLYLLEGLNVKLRPKLLADLKPGTRIVSHAFRMGDWKPEKTENVNGNMIYFWTIPPK